MVTTFLHFSNPIWNPFQSHPPDPEPSPDRAQESSPGSRHLALPVGWWQRPPRASGDLFQSEIGGFHHDSTGNSGNLIVIMGTNGNHIKEADSFTKIVFFVSMIQHDLAWLTMILHDSHSLQNNPLWPCSSGTCWGYVGLNFPGIVIKWCQQAQRHTKGFTKGFRIHSPFLPSARQLTLRWIWRAIPAANSMASWKNWRVPQSGLVRGWWLSSNF